MTTLPLPEVREPLLPVICAGHTDYHFADGVVLRVHANGVPEVVSVREAVASQPAGVAA